MARGLLPVLPTLRPAWRRLSLCLVEAPLRALSFRGGCEPSSALPFRPGFPWSFPFLHVVKQRWALTTLPTLPAFSCAYSLLGFGHTGASLAHSNPGLCERVCERVCERICVRVCVRACERACVSVHVSMCVCACV